MSVSPPRPKGPPLNALRAFEASARLGGFTAAAAELGVTPGAVAQQVRTLEDWTGVPLFTRHAQGVTLTPLGAQAAADFGHAFDALGAATNTLRAGAAPDAVRIATLPGLAQLWLSPRLPAIRAKTGAAISVSALETPPNLNRAHFDLALFFAEADGAGQVFDLGPDEIFPVCAPALAASVAASLAPPQSSPPTHIQKSDGLAGLPFLSDAAWADDWALWYGGPVATGPTHSLYALAVAEAVAGAGVLIGHEHLVRPLLDDGALVVPIDRTVRTGKRLILSLSNGTGAQMLAVALGLSGSR